MLTNHCRFHSVLLWPDRLSLTYMPYLGATKRIVCVYRSACLFLFPFSPWYSGPLVISHLSMPDVLCGERACVRACVLVRACNFPVRAKLHKLSFCEKTKQNKNHLRSLLISLGRAGIGLLQPATKISPRSLNHPPKERRRSH